MRSVMHDKELAEKMKEAASILGDYRKSLKKQIPEQWEWRKLVFEHKPVDEAENNPPPKSIKIIESQFAKMKRGNKRQTILEARI